MPVPKYQKMMLSVLKLIGSGHATISDCLPQLKQQFNVTDEEANELLPSGKQTYLSNRTHWARQYLSQAGLVVATKRGHFQITPIGSELLATGITEIDHETLKKYPKFQAFLNKSAKTPIGNDEPQFVGPVVESEETPDDLISKAHAQIEATLVTDLLAEIQDVTPARFEKLIVELLLAMGYGGGDRTMGERIGKAGDGGIDGIINEDKLGLDAVYIQAKRYAIESKVGRPALQAFVGSLTGEGANKGVFVTTSDFSKDAKEYLNKVQHRIVLINGDRLARLMIQYEVGVRVRKTYVVRGVDEEFFTDSPLG